VIRGRMGRQKQALTCRRYPLAGALAPLTPSVYTREKG
jgi:hypothetical protein